MRLRTTLQLASFFPIFMAALFVVYLFTARLTGDGSADRVPVVPVVGPSILALVSLLAGWAFYRAGQRLVLQVGTLEQMTERVKRGDLKTANPLEHGRGDVAAVAQVFSQMVVELRGYVDLIGAHEQLKRECDAVMAAAERLRASAVEVSGALELLRRAEQGAALRLLDGDLFLLSWLPSRVLRAMLGAEGNDAATSPGLSVVRPDVIALLRSLATEPAASSAPDAARPTRVLDAVRDAVVLCQWLWERERAQAPVTVRIDAAGAETFESRAGRLELVQVAAALLTNAAEAMPEGGSITVEARTDEGGGAITLSITDSGQGMSEAVRTRCMKPFFSTKEGRLGMGLPVAARLVTRHGGRLGVTGEKGHGATVVMTLPAPRTQSGAAATQAQSLPRLSLAVLLVDDDESARDALSAMLAKEGHRVTGVADGAAAVLRLRQKRFDVVMTDLAMPIMTGEELALAVKARYPSTPVVLVTGAGEELARRPNRPEGVDVILPKPVLRYDLVLALSQAMERAKPVTPDPAVPVA